MTRANLLEKETKVDTSYHNIYNISYVVVISLLK